LHRIQQLRSNCPRYCAVVSMMHRYGYQSMNEVSDLCKLSP
jgi:hypothetical protein